jgi:hypothetical protein
MTIADGTVLDTTQVVSSGSPNNRWNLVLMSDGYRSTELAQYHQHVREFIGALRATPPFDTHWGAINIYRVDVTSIDSGTDDPVNCADDPPGTTGSGASARTYFDSTVCGFGVRRLLTVNTATAQTVALAEVPHYTRAIVMVNTTLYGGSGGNPVGAFSTGYIPAVTAHEVFIHELGHTGFGLADEYGGCIPGQPNRYTGPEPGEPNVTTITDRATTKWRNRIAASTALPTQSIADCTVCGVLPASPVPAGTVGLFEDAYYAHCGIYRPEYNCKMRDLGEPFCAVCRAAIIDLLDDFSAPEPTTPMTVVDADSSKVVRMYNPAGSVVVQDTSPSLALTGLTGSGFVQCRRLPQGLPGTAAAGLFGYWYRVSLLGTSGAVGVSRLEIDIGTVTPLDYAGTGPADVFILTGGAIGTVRPSSVVRTAAGRLVLTFDPAVLASQSSFFVGFASTKQVQDTAIRVVDLAGRMYDLEGKGPTP